MTGQEAIAALKRKLNISGDAELATRLGVSHPSILNWKKRKNVTPLQLANLVNSATKASAANALVTAIRPVVEFYRIERCVSTQGAQFELFTEKDEMQQGTHPYKSGLKDELAARRGVYVFFDSRGKAIYVGKAKLQGLWKEMTSAFNRDRGSVQSIMRVQHPENRVEYKPVEEKARQIVGKEIPLHELAAYFSAYQVVPEMIDELEALLVRSFANDLLNKKMERFEGQRKTTKKRKKKQ